jgi:hypothetical protein
MHLMDISQLAIDLGLNIGANALWSIIKNYVTTTKNPTLDGLKEKLVSELKIKNADIKAEKIIGFLAQNGNITIKGTHIYAGKQITIASSEGKSFDFGNNSTSETENTKIEAKGNSKIVGHGRAKIVQKDGSISFYV